MLHSIQIDLYVKVCDDSSSYTGKGKVLCMIQRLRVQNPIRLKKLIVRSPSKSELIERDANCHVHQSESLCVFTSGLYDILLIIMTVLAVNSDKFVIINCKYRKHYVH